MITSIKNMKQFFYFAWLTIIPQKIFSMHIMEGFLPPMWSLFWYAASIPFILIGIAKIKKSIYMNPQLKLQFAVAGAYTFLLSALKIPSVGGSSSHPTGIGFGTILFGPSSMAVIGVIVLLFQALFLAHGGITTLGANVFSMAIAGPWVGFFTFKLAQKISLPVWLSIFICAFTADLFTYVVTSLQLAIAFMNNPSEFLFTFKKFVSIFALTQLPLAILEGIITFLIFDFLSKVSYGEFKLIPASNKGKIHDL